MIIDKVEHITLTFTSHEINELRLSLQSYLFTAIENEAKNLSEIDDHMTVDIMRARICARICPLTKYKLYTELSSLGNFDAEQTIDSYIECAYNRYKKDTLSHNDCDICPTDKKPLGDYYPAY